MVENRDRLLFESFQLINSLKNSYQAPQKPAFRLSGISVKQQMHEVLKELESQHIIAGYDVDIGLYLADVLSGGANSKSTETKPIIFFDAFAASSVRIPFSKFYLMSSLTRLMLAGRC